MNPNFTKEEIKWIERTADLERAKAMNYFVEILNKINHQNLSQEEKEVFQKVTSEIMELYTFLKTLNYKLMNLKDEN